jgi:nucleotide-binding universal stress UspA family protein
VYKRILVALDHSEADRVIIDHVEQLARVCGSTVVLYRVAHYHTRDSRAHEMEEAEEYLGALDAELGKQGIPCETAIGQGEPAHAIAEDAEKLECDLIAMPIHGHSSLARFVLGSVAEGVKRATKIPVLMVKAK